MFDPCTTQFQSRTQSSDVVQVKDSYEPWNYGPRAKKAAQNFTKYNSWNGTEVRFDPEMKAVDESGVCSPPLWKTSPPRSPQHRANHYRSLSPTSRTQAIAKGQKELMDMVRNMPEACYELSLKDLVEKPKLEARQQQQERNISEDRDLNLSSTEILYRRENSNNKRNDKRAQVVKRSASINSGGFYLKMVFPVSLRSNKKNNKKKKNDQSVTNTSAKVSPRPSVSDGSPKGVDKEWWKKRISVSGESESGRSSCNSESLKSSASSRSSSTRSRSSNNNNRFVTNSYFINI